MSDNPDPMVCYQRLLEAYGRGTREALAEVVAEEVIYTIHGSATLSGKYVGLDGMLSWIRLAGELSDGTARFVPEEITTSATSLVAVGTAEVIRAGKPERTGHIYRLRWSNGLLREGHTYPTDSESFASVWSWPR